MNRSKLYISDLDGTLLNSNGELSELSVSIINQFIVKRGFFSIATARSLDSTKEVLNKLNLELPFVLQNGALIYCPKLDTIIESNIISSQVFQKVKEGLAAFELHPIIYAIDSKQQQYTIFTEIENEIEKQYYEKEMVFSSNFIANLATIDLENFQITELNVYFPLNLLLELKSLLDKIPEIRFQYLENEIYLDKFLRIEITHVNATKEKAVEWIRNYIQADRMVCFGDSSNDLGMFQIANESYAVRNAIQSIKDLATLIIGTNDEDGVAKFLMKLLPNFEQEQ